MLSKAYAAARVVESDKCPENATNRWLSEFADEASRVTPVLARTSVWRAVTLGCFRLPGGFKLAGMDFPLRLFLWRQRLFVGRFGLIAHTSHANFLRSRPACLTPTNFTLQHVSESCQKFITKLYYYIV